MMRRLFQGLEVLLLAAGSALAAEPAARVVVHPADTGAALINPGMGWTMHFYSNVPGNYGSKLDPADDLDWFPGCSTVYLRVPWAYIEPEEGRFNWNLLDAPAQRWIASGGQVAFRITCSENWTRHATPEWVKKAGAKGVDYKWGEGPVAGGPMWDPDFLDPVFLDKLDRFLAAMARRYDGNPNVAFIDIGSFGMWGEGHTGGSSRLSPEKTLEVVKRHIDLHKKHFPRTLLAISDDVDGHDNRSGRYPAMDYARERGVTFRDDSILVQPPPRSWYHADMAQAFWPTLPVILEHEHFGPSQARKAWNPDLLFKAVEDYHATFLSIHWWPREFLDANSNVVDRINRRLGYRLVPGGLAWPAEVKIGARFAVEGTWSNVGVAPLYASAFPALTFKDAKGGIVAVLVDESLDLRTLETGPAGAAPAKSHRAEFAVGLVAPTTPTGTCDVFVSVGTRDGTPRIALPIAGDDGARRYRVGTIKLVR